MHARVNAETRAPVLTPAAGPEVPGKPGIGALALSVAAAVATAALVAVPPAVLWLLVGNPLPEGVPGWEALRRAVTDGQVAERTLLKALALVCWVAWIEAVVAITAELVGAARGRGRPGVSVPRVPVPGAFRSLAVLLVAGMSLSSSSDTAGADDLPPLPGLPSLPSLPFVADPAAADGPRLPDLVEHHDPAHRPDEPGDGHPAERRVERPVEHPVEHVVERRDSLWGIAATRLGDPYRWPEILELNRGREQPDGGRLRDPGDTIRPGWVLALPAPSTRVTVEEGDTLWDLARDHLDTPTRWPEIAAANAGRIDDPDLILPGWELALPGDGPRGEASPEARDDRSDPLDAAREAEEAAEAADADARDALGRIDRAIGPASDERPAADPPEPDPRPGEVPGELPGEPPDEQPGEPPDEQPGEPPGEPPGELPGELPGEPPEEAFDAAPEGGRVGDDPDDPLPEPAASETSAGDRLRLPAPETWPDRRDDHANHLDGYDLDGYHLDGYDDIAAVEPRPGSLARSLAGASIFAAGVAWTIGRLRRVGERWRRAGDAVEPSEHPRTEVAIRQAADADLMVFLDTALKLFATGLRDEGRAAPPIVGVNVAEELSLLFGEADLRPVAGFAVEDDGFSWVIPRTGPLPSAPEVATPLPALFTLGHTERSQVLVNPETANSIAVRGPGLDVQEALFTMAAELATGPWAGTVKLVCVGFGRELGVLENVDVVEAVRDALPVVEPHAKAAGDLLAAHGLASSVDARVAEVDGGASHPVVVLCAPSSDAAEIRALLEIAHRTDRSGVTAVVAGDHETTWRVELAGDRVHLAPMDVQLTRHRLGDEHRAALGDLLARATRFRALRRPGPDATTGVRRATDGEQIEPAGLDLPEVASDPPVEVCVLGPVQVRGRATDFHRRKALELVVYLALHRGGVEPDVVMEALWPDRLIVPGTLHTTTSLARRCLGSDPSGAPYLPHVGPDGLYRVSDTLSLDHDRFATHLDRARRRDPAGAVDDLRAALGLVRGRPFAATGIEYLWTHAESLTTAIVAEITDAAHELACLYLDADDHRGVWWATQQGLLASPGNEQLHRDRMFAADLAGNPAGVEEVMEELCRAIEIDGDEMHDVLHPLTLEVYEQLTRRPRSNTLV